MRSVCPRIGNTSGSGVTYFAHAPVQLTSKRPVALEIAKRFHFARLPSCRQHRKNWSCKILQIARRRDNRQVHNPAVRQFGGKSTAGIFAKKGNLSLNQGSLTWCGNTCHIRRRPTPLFVCSVSGRKCESESSAHRRDLPDTLPPDQTAPAALDAVACGISRVKTRTSKPADCKLSAELKPITPAPMTVTSGMSDCLAMTGYQEQKALTRKGAGAGLPAPILAQNTVFL